MVRDKEGTTVVVQPSLAEWMSVDKEQVRRFLDEMALEAHAAQPDLVGAADVTEGALVSGLMRISKNPDVKPARLSVGEWRGPAARQLSRHENWHDERDRLLLRECEPPWLRGDVWERS